jgi:general secretion pathway protein H
MSKIDGRAGFTLLEMLAVMMIVALVSSLAFMMIPGTGRAGLKAVTLDAAALLRRARLRAMLSGHAQRIVLDSEHRALIAEDGEHVVIPHDVVLDTRGVDQLWSGRRAVVQFNPEGGSSGAVLKFSRERAQYDVRVNWFTGSVAVESSAAD